MLRVGMHTGTLCVLRRRASERGARYLFRVKWVAEKLDFRLVP